MGSIESTTGTLMANTTLLGERDGEGFIMASATGFGCAVILCAYLIMKRLDDDTELTHYQDYEQPDIDGALAALNGSGALDIVDCRVLHRVFRKARDMKSRQQRLAVGGP